MNRTNMKKMQMKKRILSFILAFLIVAIETGIMAFVWVKYYNTELPKAYFFWGHIFISAVYMAILFISSSMYGGLKIGANRMLELMFSQSFSTIITNILFYAIVCMLAYHFPSIIPIVLGTVVQGICIAAWIYLSTYFYRAAFPPLDIVLIYGGQYKDLFVEKVKTRRHQFNISASVEEKADYDVIFSEIDKHEAVMLWDINTSTRDTIFKYCYDKSIEIYVMPKIMDIILMGSTTLHFFDSPLLLTKSSPLEAEQLFVKRLFDILFSIFLLIIASPFMLVVAICIKLYDRGPILYKQVRCTVDNREFEIYKFRSMIVEAEKDGVARLATKNDDRITPVGHIIRKTRLDELPQLFNVLKGDMSFVGPRPERPQIIQDYIKNMPEFSYRTKVKAGLTGYAQIYGKYNTLPYDKLKLDLYYIENFSVWLDLRLIILTAKIVFSPDSTEGVSAGNITAVPAGNSDEKDKQ